MPKVLISDKLSPAAVDIFRRRGVEADLKPGLTPAELRAIIPGYDGLAIRSATKVTRELLDAATNLTVIGRAGIGVDNVDIRSATARGVVVMNTPHGNTITTAEHAIAMMFALARQVPRADASTRAGKWEKNRFLGVELTNKILGVIGCGNIGSIVADRGIGLRMKVIAYDPYLSEKRALDLGVEKVELDTLLERADFITLHTPLTDATKNILSREALARTRAGVRVINCARGGLLDEAALADAIKAGHVAGAALDVFENEPATSSPLFDLDNVICTPHLGAATAEAQENVAQQIAEQISDFLLTGAISNAINMASVTAEEAPRLRPYMELCRSLGSFAGQLTQAREGAIRRVSIEFEGLASGLNTKPMTAAALSGLMSPLMAGVNMVNAAVAAREHGIDVAETVHDRPSEYQTLVRITIETDGLERSLAGTLFAGSRPRIVEIKGIKVEADFAPHMLYVTNQDRPGFIGRFGATLAGAGINIATFHLGRASLGGDAICLVSVDESVPEDVLAMVRTLPLVVQATALAFLTLGKRAGFDARWSKAQSWVVGGQALHGIGVRMGLILALLVSGGASAETKRIFPLPPRQWDNSMSRDRAIQYPGPSDLANLTGGIVFGLSPTDVNAHLPTPVPGLTWEAMPFAIEYPDDVRYFWVRFDTTRELRAGVTGCAGVNSYIVFLFRRRSLFRVSWRLVPDAACPSPAAAAEDILARYIAIDGSSLLATHYHAGPAEAVEITDPNADYLIPYRWTNRQRR